MATVDRPSSGLHIAEAAARPSAASARRWALVILIAVVLAAFYLSGLHRQFSWEALRLHLDEWKRAVDANLLVAIAIFALCYVAATALSLPIALGLSLIGGALFGRWIGTGVISVAATAGATLAFLGTRYLLRDWVERRFGDRLRPLREGVERDGAYYLFTLRLVPLFPFFLVNLGMGLTRMRPGIFARVSWLGMLPGTFVFVNAGTAAAQIHSPADVLSPGILASFALIGIVPLLIRLIVRRRIRGRTIAMVSLALLLLAAAGVGVRTWLRYRTQPEMVLAIREYGNDEYPEDPSDRSEHYGQYNGRRLRLIQKDDVHFDFVFESDHPHVARVAFRDVDVSLMTPSLPEWAKGDAGLRRIALTDRQWNRQQVCFDIGPDVEVSGGNGFESKNLFSAKLAKNCLNAGLWEVLLYVRDRQGGKSLYYQGWFTFPLGHYARLFERNTGLPYWRHWYYLEHWFDPSGTPIALDRLRHVEREWRPVAIQDRGEEVVTAGEQTRKRRTLLAENVVHWDDFYPGREVHFATFIAPGRYSVQHPWNNEFWRMDRLDSAVLRETRAAGSGAKLHEIELIYTGRDGSTNRFLVGGIDLAQVPQLPRSRYPEGLYMPMGIGVPPFFQTYDELKNEPPQRSPYFSVMLNERDEWIDHHRVGIDGPVMHRDEKDPDLLHLYLLSYERHSLVDHVVISLK